MMKYSKLIILLVLFVLCPKNVDALLCPNDEKVKYQEMAKNIAYTYDAKEVKGKTVFSVTFSNMPSSLALMNPIGGKWYYSKGKDLTISNLETNKNYRYDVYVTGDTGCTDIVLYTLNIVLPSYNKYHSDPACEGIENYKLCQKWANVNYSYEEWKIKIQEYKDSLIPEEEVKTSKEKRMSLIEKIIDVYADVYYIVFPIIIIICIIWIYVYNKRRELF